MQKAKQTLEARGVSASILQEKCALEMLAGVNVFRLPRVFKFQNQTMGAGAARALKQTLKTCYCCVWDERILLSLKQGAFRFPRSFHP